MQRLKVCALLQALGHMAVSELCFLSPARVTFSSCEVRRRSVGVGWVGDRMDRMGGMGGMGWDGLGWIGLGGGGCVCASSAVGSGAGVVSQLVGCSPPPSMDSVSADQSTGMAHAR
jgi:hypothetical protein